MNKIMKRQTGVTFLGWCTILAIIGFFVLLTLRLYPLVYEKIQVVSAMNSVASRADVTKKSDQQIIIQFLRTVQVGGSQRFDDKFTKDHVKIEKPKKKGDPKVLHVFFEARNDFFKDIKFILEFDESVELGGASSE